MFKLQYLRNSRIATKFILWFLFIALLPLTVATVISYNSSRKVLKEEVVNRLFAVADKKANQIEVYLRDIERNVTQLSLVSDLAIAIEMFQDAGERGSPKYNAVDQKIRPLITYYQKSFGYDDILLIDTEGNTLFSVTKKESFRSLYEIILKEESELANLFLKTTKSLKTEVSHFVYFKDENRAVVYIAAPILEGGNLVGIVIAQMSNQGLYKLVQDYSGLGKTGEATVAVKSGNDAVFITPLRFDPRATFRRKISIGSAIGLDMQNAIQGEKGSGISVDYRGKEVLATWRHLPFFKLGLVVKMDAEEIFTSAKQLRNTLLIASIILLLIVVLMAVVIAHSISRPINELTDVSGVITGGDLSARVKVNTKDEIGELADSFNHMTDSLVQAKASVEQERAKLEEQKKLLEKANQELDSFTYTVSHDLRAPLRAITRFSDFLEEDYSDKLEGDAKNYLANINKGAQRMKELIDDLLTLSRISRIKNPYEDVSMNDIINSIVERIKLDIKENNVDLKIQENMPIIRCDRIKISEVFLNLMTNAIKFSSKNKEENPRVEIGYEDKDTYYKFYVRDNGIGIEPEYKEEIFGIFRRLHTSREYEGTGAGLSIVRRIIDDHGGNIWVESELGKGATFYFIIPKFPKQEE